jgi:RecB family endonuclease NucS
MSTEEDTRNIALNRIESAVAAIRNDRPSAAVTASERRAGHVEQLEVQTIDLLTDAIEIVETENDYATAADLLSAADAQLEAIQHLSVHDSQADAADSVSDVRDKISAVNGVFSFLQSQRFQ